MRYFKDFKIEIKSYFLFFKEGYGKGAKVTIKELLQICCFMLSIFILFALIFPMIFENTIQSNIIMYKYVSAVFLLMFFWCLAVYFYTHEIPIETKKDKYKYIKKFNFYALSIIILLAILPVLVPIAFLHLIFDFIGKLLKMEQISRYPIESIISMGTWLFFSFILLGVIAFGLNFILSNQTSIYYSVFLSIFITNFITKRIFYILIGIKNKRDKIQQIEHEITLFWYYVLFFITITIRPLDLGNYNIIKDSIFFSTAILTIINNIQKHNRAETKNEN